ncbi:MAG: VanZ family protein [Cyclobacteriaceae bacterium]|nr:VanZ family protein [Cyclobacteriaceae bacterium]MDH4298503.1 VanZ family protein [Cyclobacteriaceae bacterium]MDH5251464.1 VanZ family protein [Cyclobacteriaceae bacterium]
MKITLKSFWPAVVGLIVATVLLLLPGQEFPKRDWMSKIYLDKWVHLGLFAMLVALWSLPLISRIDEGSRLRNIFFWIAMGFIAYGIAIEFIQGNFIPYRTFGVDDMIADAVGSGIGFLFARRQLRNQ